MLWPSLGASRKGGSPSRAFFSEGPLLLNKKTSTKANLLRSGANCACRGLPPEGGCAQSLLTTQEKIVYGATSYIPSGHHPGGAAPIVSHEFTLLGYQPTFLKLLLGGDPMQLPIKGSHIFKRDNPIFLAASNHSLRDLSLREHRYTCYCKLPDNSPFWALLGSRSKRSQGGGFATLLLSKPALLWWGPPGFFGEKAQEGGFAKLSKPVSFGCFLSGNTQETPSFGKPGRGPC